MKLDRARIESLAAQSLYESLDDRDRAALDSGLEAYPDLRAEYQDFKRVKELIGMDGPALDEDLLPEVRARIDSMPAARESGAGWRIAAFAAAAGIAIIAFTYSLMPAQQGNLMQADSEAIVSTPVAMSMAAAEALMDDGSCSDAYASLEEAIEAHPDDAYAGQALLMMADLAYDELHRFDDAHDAYARYRNDFSVAYQRHTRRNEIYRRWEMLESTAGEEYQALNILAQAEIHGEDAADELESVMVRHAASFVAEDAAFSLARIVHGEDALLDGAGMHAALQTARSACTNPVAQDQVDFILGKYTLETIGDAAAAEPYLDSAAGSSDERVALAAKEVLRSLR